MKREKREKPKAGRAGHDWRLISVRLRDEDVTALERLAVAMGKRAGLREPLTLSHALREAVTRGIEAMEAEL